MATDNTRLEYLRALLNQKAQQQANGNNLVNPSVDNNVDTLAYNDTIFNGATRNVAPNLNENIEKTTKSNDDLNFFQKVDGFLDEIGGRIYTGAYKGIEGIFDFGATTLGAITGNENFTKWAEQDISSALGSWMQTYEGDTGLFNIIKGINEGKYDQEYFNRMFGSLGDVFKSAAFAQNNLNYDFNELAQQDDSNKYEVQTKAGEITMGLAQSFGEMLPSIALGDVIGVAGNAAGWFGEGAKATELVGKVARAVGLTTFGLAAAGNASEEALNRGATAEEALTEGAIKGGVEVLSEIVVGKALEWASKGLHLEKLADAFGGNIQGIKIGDISLLNKKEIAMQIGASMFEEGLEEVFSDVFAPVAEYFGQKGSDAWYGENGKFYLVDSSFWKQAGESFISGALMGGISSGGQSIGNFIQFGGEEGEIATRASIQAKFIQEKYNEQMAKGVDEQTAFNNLNNDEEIKKIIGDKDVREYQAKLYGTIIENYNKVLAKSESKANNLLKLMSGNQEMLNDLKLASSNTINEADQKLLEMKLIGHTRSETELSFARRWVNQVTNRANESLGINTRAFVVNASDMYSAEALEKKYGIKFTEQQRAEIENGAIRKSDGVHFVDINGQQIALIAPYFKKSATNLFLHEVITHSFVDSDIKSRNKLLESLNSNEEFKELYNKKRANVEKEYKDQIDEKKTQEAKDGLIESETLASIFEEQLNNKAFWDNLSNASLSRLGRFIQKIVDAFQGSNKKDSIQKSIQKDLKGFVINEVNKRINSRAESVRDLTRTQAKNIKEARKEIGDIIKKGGTEKEIVKKIDEVSNKTIKTLKDKGNDYTIANVLKNVDTSMKHSFSSFGMYLGLDSYVKIRNTDGKIERYSNSDAVNKLGGRVRDKDVVEIGYNIDGVDVPTDELSNLSDKKRIDLVEKSPIGAMLKLFFGDTNSDLYKQQLKSIAEYTKLLSETSDAYLTQQFVGSMFFYPIRNNSDSQYSYTIDLEIVCKKTQAMVDAMSKLMLEKKRGLTTDEIKDLYAKQVNEGRLVPCPMCYVFSRWVGVGGILNNLDSFQKEYENLTPKGKEEVLKKLDDDVKKQYGSSDSKSRSKYINKIDNNYTRVLGELQEIERVGYTRYLQEAKKNTIDKVKKMGGESKYLDSLMKEKEDLEKTLKSLQAYTWLKEVQGNEKPVPPEILWDLNAGDEFAMKYPLAWKWRTTRGPSAGKAITPYADTKPLQIIEGLINGRGRETAGRVDNNSNSEISKRSELATYNEEHNRMEYDIKKVMSQYFTQDENGKTIFTSKGAKLVEKAAVNVMKQNLIGGTRLQSYSDMKEMNVSDYLLAFLELQLAHSKGQTYTKVLFAVPFFNSVGICTNMSLMPFGAGYNEKGELVFSDTTGILHELAFDFLRQYRYAGTIMVGINDKHIKLCLNDKRISMVIPYHASGGNSDLIASWLGALKEKADISSYTSYEESQEDVWLPSSKLTEQQKRYRELRNKILGRKSLTNKELSTIKSDKQLNTLYNKLEANDGVKFSSNSKIYPYEFWDTSVDYEHSSVNSKNFLEYCEKLGVQPRFSQFASEDYYWKLIVDRKMYDYNTGEYLEQPYISLNNLENANRLQESQFKGADELLARVRAGIQADSTIKHSRVDDRKWDYDFNKRAIAKYQNNQFKDFNKEFGSWYQANTNINKEIVEKIFNGRVSVVDNNDNLKELVNFYKEVAKDKEMSIKYFDLDTYSDEYFINKKLLPPELLMLSEQLDEQDIPLWLSINFNENANFGDTSYNGISINLEKVSETNVTIAEVQRHERIHWYKAKKLSFINEKYIKPIMRLFKSTDSADGSNLYKKLRERIDKLYTGVYEEEFVNRNEKLDEEVLTFTYQQDKKFERLFEEFGVSKDVNIIRNNLTKAIKDEYKNSGFRFSISELKGENVNASEVRKIIDSEGNKLSKEQQEFFKDSKVRNKNGNLMVMYHGSNTDFNEFTKTKKHLFGTWLTKNQYWFTNSEDYAKQFGVNVKSVYLNIKNPLIVGNDYSITIGNRMYTDDDIRNYLHLRKNANLLANNAGLNAYERFISEKIDAFKIIRSRVADANDFYYNEGYLPKEYKNATDEYIIKHKNEIYNHPFLKDNWHNITLDDFQIIDGFVDNTARSRGIKQTFVVAFNSNQIKSINNTNPTENPDIRFSLSSDYDLSQEELYEIDKMVDEMLDIDDLESKEENIIKQQKDESFVAHNKTNGFLEPKYQDREKLKKFRLSGKTASFSDERIKDRYERSMARMTSYEYAQEYLTYISPQEFLELTLPIRFHSTSLDDNLSSSAESDFSKDNIGKLNTEELKRQSQPIYLYIENGTGKVFGHEGRHRMYALMNAGYTNVQIMVQFRNKDFYIIKNVANVKVPSTLKGQKFNKGIATTLKIPFNNEDLIALSENNLDATLESAHKYESSLQYSRTNSTNNVGNNIAFTPRESGYYADANEIYKAINTQSLVDYLISRFDSKLIYRNVKKDALLNLAKQIQIDFNTSNDLAKARTQIEALVDKFMKVSIKETIVENESGQLQFDFDDKTEEMTLTDYLTKKKVDVEDFRKEMIDALNGLFDAKLEVSKIQKTVDNYEAKVNKIIERANDKLAKVVGRYTSYVSRLTEQTKEYKGRIGFTKKITSKIKNIPNQINASYNITDDNIARDGLNFLLKPFKSLKVNSQGRYTELGLREAINEVLSKYNEENFKKNAEAYSGLEYDDEVRQALEDILDAIDNNKESYIERKNKKGEVISNRELNAETLKAISRALTMIQSTIRQTQHNSLRFYKPISESVAISINGSIINKQTWAKLIQKYARGFAPSYAVVERIFGASPLTDLIVKQGQKAKNLAQLFEGRYTTLISEKMKELKLKKNYGSIKYEINGVELDAGQIIYLYNSLKTEANFDAIVEDGIVYKDKDGNIVSFFEKCKPLKDENGNVVYDENKKVVYDDTKARRLLGEIVQKVPENVLKMGDFLRDLMNTEIKQEYINWYEAKYGKFDFRNEIGEIGDGSYWMLNRYYQYEANVDKMVKNPSGIFKNAIRRVNNHNEVMLGDGLSGVTTYISALSNEIYNKPIYNQVISILNSKYDGRSLKAILQETIGVDNYNYVLRTIGDMIGEKVEGGVDVLGGIMSRFTIAKLGFKVSTILKQYASIKTSNLPIPKTAKTLRRLIFAGKEYREEFKALLDEKDGIGGLIYRKASNTARLSNADAKLKGTAEDVADFGMRGITWMDMATVSLGAYTLMTIAKDEYNYEIGSKENIDYVKEHWYEFELSQIGNSALSRNAIRRGDYKQIAKSIFGFMQGANIAAFGSFLHKAGLWQRNIKVDIDALNAQLEEVTKNGAKLDKSYDRKLKQIEKVEAQIEESLNESNNNKENYSSDELKEMVEERKKLNDKLRKLKNELSKIESNIISNEAKRLGLESRINDYESFKIAGGKAIPAHMAFGLIAQGIIITIINTLIKRLLGKKDWDDWDIGEIGTELVLNITTAWLPLVNVLVNLAKGYDIQVPTIEVMNEIGSILNRVVTNDYKGALRDVVLLVGDATGLPFNTFYDYAYGIVKMVDPEAAWDMNVVMYQTSIQNASKQLNGYAEKGNKHATNRMVGIILHAYKGMDASDSIKKEISNLYLDGYGVMPKGYMTTYTNENGVEVELTKEQITQFKELYNKSNKIIEDLISKDKYSTLTSEDKSKLIRKIYDAYYDYAKSVVVGVQPSSRLAQLVAYTDDNYNIANIMSILSVIQNIKDSKTKTRKELVFTYINRLHSISSADKLLILKLAGYSVSDSDRLSSYLKRKGMNKKELEAFLQ